MKTTDRIYSFVTEKLQEYGEMTFREIAELVKELLKDEYDEKQLHNCMQSLKKKGIVSRNSNNKYYLLYCGSNSTFSTLFRSPDPSKYLWVAESDNGYVCCIEDIGRI